jgi:hypothetical protein
MTPLEKALQLQEQLNEYIAQAERGEPTPLDLDTLRQLAASAQRAIGLLEEDEVRRGVYKGVHK